MILNNGNIIYVNIIKIINIINIITIHIININRIINAICFQWALTSLLDAKRLWQAFHAEVHVHVHVCRKVLPVRFTCSENIECAINIYQKA